ncbi:MAG: response regulator [bacterium]|nr:response regulator [bacterium]
MHNSGHNKGCDSESIPNQLVKAILTMIADPVILIDADTRIHAVNPSFEKAFRWRASDLIGDRIERLVPQSMLATYNAVARNLKETGSPEVLDTTREYPVLKKGGEIAHCVMTLSRLSDDYADTPFLVTFKDVSKFREKENLLLRQVDFNMLVARINLNFINIDNRELDGCIRQSLGEIARFVDVDHGYAFFVRGDDTCDNTYEWCGENVEPGIGELRDLDIDWSSWFWRELAQGRTISFSQVKHSPPEDELFRQYLTTRNILNIVVIPMMSDDRCIGFIGFDSTIKTHQWSPMEIDMLKVVGDIIANAIRLRENEAALRIKEQHFRAIAENSPGIVYSYRKHIRSGRRTSIYFNRELDRLFGSEVAGRIREDTNVLETLVHEDDIAHTQMALSRSRKANLSIDIEMRVKTLQGYIWMRSTANSIPLENGDRLWNGLLLDVSERKRYQEQLKTNSRELEKSNTSLLKAKSQADAALLAKNAFLANISHEIRTPLTAILGFTDILAEEVTSPVGKEALEVIRENGGQLHQIIGDILDLAKIEANKCELSFSRVSVIELLRQIEIQMRMRIDEKEIYFVISCDDDIPDTILTDQLRLRQILANIIGNAIKFTDSGGINIDVGLVHGSSADRMIRIVIRDTGIGMKQEEIAKLFEPFTQADATTIRKYGGTGLGLSISKGLIEILSGRIDVQSVPGQGSEFSVVIPIDQSDSTTKIVPTDDRTLRPLPSGTRVLIAEDNPTNCLVISHILTRANAEIQVVENGAVARDTALQAWREGNPFDVILMDIQMPVLDGHRATEALRKAGYLGIIIALTAHTSERDRELSLQAGCDMHSNKPIDRIRLLNAINLQLEKRQ